MPEMNAKETGEMTKDSSLNKSDGIRGVIDCVSNNIALHSNVYVIVATLDNL